MKTTYLLPFFLGAAAVIQAGVNRTIAAHASLPAAVLINTGVLAIVALAFFFIQGSALPSPRSLPWIVLIPGIMGFCLVAGIPFVITRIGALQTFVIFVAGQLFFSMIWDRWVESLPLTPARLGAAALTFAGVLLTMKK